MWKRVLSFYAAVSFCAVSIWGCGSPVEKDTEKKGEYGEKKPKVEERIKKVLGVIKPSIWGELSLPVKTYPLPKEAAKTEFTLVIYQGVMWLGGPFGLYQQRGKKWGQIEKRPVVGIAEWQSKTKGDSILLVAFQSGLEIWSEGLFTKSSFNRELNGEKIKVLKGSSPREFWLGTDRALWVVQPAQYWRFEVKSGVKGFWWGGEKGVFVLQRGDGTFEIWIKEKSGKFVWNRTEVKSEKTHKEQTIQLQALFPMSEGRFWGVSNGELFVRERGKDGLIRWWPYQLAEENKSGCKIERIAPAPESDTLWLWCGGEILRVDLDEVRVLKGANLKGTPNFFRYYGGRGLWVAEGEQLYQIGYIGRKVTYSDDIKPFMEKNCTRCHRKNGTADFLPLQSYHSVKKAIDKIIQRVEKGEMPPPPAKLVGGDVSLLKEWVAGGFKR